MYLGHHDFGIVPAPVLGYLGGGSTQYHHCGSHIHYSRRWLPERFQLCQITLVQGVESGFCSLQSRLSFS